MVVRLVAPEVNIFKLSVSETVVVSSCLVNWIWNDVPAEEILNKGIDVVCAGLDQDYQGNPFGPIPHLLAIADSVLKVQAICTVCGAAASKTYRKVEQNRHEQVLVGETEMYEARCRGHIDYFEELVVSSVRDSDVPEKSAAN